MSGNEVFVGYTPLGKEQITTNQEDQNGPEEQGAFLYEARPASFSYYDAQHPERCQPLWPARRQDGPVDLNSPDYLMLKEIRSRTGELTEANLFEPMAHSLGIGMAAEAFPRQKPAKLDKAFRAIERREGLPEGGEAPIVMFARGIVTLGRLAVQVPNPLSPITLERLRAYIKYEEYSGNGDYGQEIIMTLLECLADCDNRQTVDAEQWGTTSATHPRNDRDFATGYLARETEADRKSLLTKAAGFVIKGLSGLVTPLSDSRPLYWRDRWFALSEADGHHVTVQPLSPLLAIGNPQDGDYSSLVPTKTGSLKSWDNDNVGFMLDLPGGKTAELRLSTPDGTGLSYDNLVEDQKRIVYAKAPKLVFTSHDTSLRILSTEKGLLVLGAA